MATLVLDRDLEERLKAERRASGADRHDEAWDGVYHMSPPAGDEHQEIVARFSGILSNTIDLPALGSVRAGVNVSDREEDWQTNYRIPDVAVFLAGTAARNCGTHWLGPPDFAIEIADPGDETRDKLPFYGKVGIRELLLIDRDPWSMELHRLRDGRLLLEATSGVTTGEWPASEALPLSFRLVPVGAGRPRIEVAHGDGARRWLV
jgi:Uma2 family endonuclease